MLYEVEVRPGPGVEFFQYYTETVEAPTSHDAEARVQRANPGCIVRTTKSWEDYDDDGEYSGSSSGISGGFVLLALGAFILVAAWKYVLVVGVIGLGIWLLLNNSN